MHRPNNQPKEEKRQLSGGALLDIQPKEEKQPLRESLVVRMNNLRASLFARLRGREDRVRCAEDDTNEVLVVLEGERRTSLSQTSKLKRGLPGSVNGCRTSAMADTGSAQNVVSASYARQMKVDIQGSPSTFRLGNSKKVQSIGG